MRQQRRTQIFLKNTCEIPVSRIYFFLSNRKNSKLLPLASSASFDYYYPDGSVRFELRRCKEAERLETKREEQKKESLAIFCLFSVGEMIVDGRRHSRKEVCLLPPEAAAAAAASNTAIFARYLFSSSAAGGIFKRKTEMAFSHLCKVVLGRKEGRGPQRRLLWQHFSWQQSKHWHVRGRQKKKFRQQAKTYNKSTKYEKAY